jgi:V8-like Glu-specific endopeptidase
VQKGQDEPFGSGVIIGEGLVLTCKHVGERFPPDSMEIWVDYETRSDNARQKQTYAVKAVLAAGEQLPQMERPLDYALLEINPPNHEGGTALANLPAATLSAGTLARDDAIYVVGHPNKNPRMVHDNAFVLFPYRVSKMQMTELQMIVCSEIQESKDREAELNQFLDSYVSSDSGNTFVQFSKRWWQSPVIAADCDTYHGNSGSAAWSRSTNRVVGILFAGEYDLGPEESYAAGWRSHEAILPISVILEQLDTQLAADWREKYKVKVE